MPLFIPRRRPENRLRAGTRKPVAILAALALGVVASGGIADATGTAPGHGVTRNTYASFTTEDKVKAARDSTVFVYSLTVQPLGHSVWHYHPGPHIVSVKTGTVWVYETDCSHREYVDRAIASGPGGGETGFYDPGQTDQKSAHIHILRNPSTTQVAEVVITDIRHKDLALFHPANPEPGPCFS